MNHYITPCLHRYCSHINAAKNWQIGWYDDRKLLLNPLNEASDWSQSVTLVGIADYLNNPAGHNVVIKIGEPLVSL